MKISATKLRQNLYRILDDVVDKGIQVVVERHGKKAKIIAEQPVRKLDQLEKHDTIKGDPEELVHMDWSSYWKGAC